MDHLRLVMGTSVGAMHTWVWGSLYPEAMDALMPLANAPVKIAGRNRMFRAMIIQAARDDPEWKGGEYTARRSANGLRNLRAVHDFRVQKQSHAGTSLGEASQDRTFTCSAERV